MRLSFRRQVDPSFTELYPETAAGRVDAQDRASLALRLLFTTQPSDRALTGWSCVEAAESSCFPLIAAEGAA